MSFFFTIAKRSAAVLLVIAVIYLLTSDLGGRLETFQKQNTVLFVAVAFTVLLSTQIVAPLSGFPVYLVIARYYGMELAFVLLGTAYLVSSFVNFSIARKYGANVLRLVAGSGSLRRVDTLSSGQSAFSVFLSRLAGYYFHDVVSYLWGLTSIRLYPYMAGTVAGTLLAVVAQYLVFRNIDVTSSRDLLIFYLGLVLCSGVSYLGWRAVFERRS
ncbi:MAG TPA: hypothetical protein VF702_07405 [Allosphingosinicella sp.]|jgi:uncharacterized membrane protein YdjX (TVP38/TMEM64 family)